jgi:hypothetical protein
MARGYYQRIVEMLASERSNSPDRTSDTPAQPRRAGVNVSRFVGYGLLLIVAAAALTYIGDYLLIRYRVARQQNPYGTVVVSPYYAEHLKSGNTAYEFQAPQTVPCVNSLFPHFGMTPCWYARRHPEKRIDI